MNDTKVLVQLVNQINLILYSSEYDRWNRCYCCCSPAVVVVVVKAVAVVIVVGSRPTVLVFHELVAVFLTSLTSY